MIILILLIITTFALPLSERYHTFYEVEQQLLDWDEQFSNDDNPWPAQYPGSCLLYTSPSPRD